jgi:hypothetical protein
LAYLKTKRKNYFIFIEYQKCIDDCENTLKIDTKYVKAYHRKAKALIGLSNILYDYMNI